MKRKKLLTFASLCIMAAMMTWGCAQNSTSPSDSAARMAVAQTQSANVYTGKIVGKSNKAKTLSIEVGTGDQTKTMMVKFDDNTVGLEHAANGEAAIVAWEMHGDDKYATVIKPKLAKLPEGVAAITPNEVKELIDDNVDFMLIDSRPESRYAQSHLPGAVSIPVERMNTSTQEILPPEKDKLLIFYCGGYT